MYAVEDQLAAAIPAVGGRRVTEVLGLKPGHDNADFFFPDYKLIIELKCLQKDVIRDERFIEKATDLHLAEYSTQGNVPIVFGETVMTTEGASAEFTQKIINLYRIPVERVIKKADRQLKETAVALRMDPFLGLLMVANDNHEALDPDHLRYLVNLILSEGKYKHIHGAVVLSGNLPAAVPGVPHRIDYWIQIVMPQHAHRLGEFLAGLRAVWYARLGKVLGQAVPQPVEQSMDALPSLKSTRMASIPGPDTHRPDGETSSR